MKRLNILFSNLYVLFFLSVDAFGSQKTLCGFGEITIASCILNEEKSRILSFCSSADKKIVFYRFGTKSKIDLSRKFSLVSPMSRWVDKWTFTTYLGFRVNEHAYVLGVPQERYGARAFLEVAKNDKAIMERSCIENSFGQKKLDSEAIRDVEDSVVRDNKFLFPPIDGTNSTSQEP
ncbi:hypothetical protein AABC73_02895 [Pseudomonas sp. G.S.17]|uniref:hypothetical protein n=1 Tax=Pseudomonas sp. G.S.17 TaxID=3137451 RepID=UPI00311CB5D0